MRDVKPQAITINSYLNGPIKTVLLNLKVLFETHLLGLSTTDYNRYYRPDIIHYSTLHPHTHFTEPDGSAAF